MYRFSNKILCMRLNSYYSVDQMMIIYQILGQMASLGGQGSFPGFTAVNSTPTNGLVKEEQTPGRQ